MPQINTPLQSWLDIPDGSHFNLDNLPFGIYKKSNGHTAVGVALGDYVIKMDILHQLGYLNSLRIDSAVFEVAYLNDLMAYGRIVAREIRHSLQELFHLENDELSSKPEHVALILESVKHVEMVMPVRVGDYTDFYSSREHATNVGTMFRDPSNALLPNWLHLPVGYHGRSSSIVVSGTPVTRPKGQTFPEGADRPVFGPTKQLDFELEIAFITCNPTALGESITVDQAEDHIWGMVLFNDWSARDIQKWEYVPLGPFLAKNFASSISPWVVTMDALEPFRVPGPVQDPTPLPYLQSEGNHNFDIQLSCIIETASGVAKEVSRSNFKYMYWNICQQLAHHTVNGCNINTGDMMASGTISGPDSSSYGSMLEICWKGTKPVQMLDGTERKFILDGDTVVMKGWCSKENLLIGFGELRNVVLPAN